MKIQTIVSSILATAAANAAVVTLSPTDIHGDNTATTLFSNADITLTPTITDVSGVPQPATFNANAARLGIDDNPLGTNNNGFTDGDVIVGNAGEEGLIMAFSGTSGLTQIAYDFSRADGPGANDGVIISGFLADPNVTFSVSNPNLFAVYNAIENSVRLNIPGTLFGGTRVEVNFNPATSAGETLTLAIHDTTQAGAQLAVLDISYNNDVLPVPEPSSALLSALAVIGLLRRRR